MQLTLKLVLQLLSLFCFLVVALGARAWRDPASHYGWGGYGFLGAGLFLWEASVVFSA